MGKLHRLLNEAFEHNRPSNKVTLVVPFITKTLLFFRDQNPSFFQLFTLHTMFSRTCSFSNLDLSSFIKILECITLGKISPFF